MVPPMMVVVRATTTKTTPILPSTTKQCGGVVWRRVDIEGILLLLLLTQIANAVSSFTISTLSSSSPSSRFLSPSISQRRRRCNSHFKYAQTIDDANEFECMVNANIDTTIATSNGTRTQRSRMYSKHSSCKQTTKSSCDISNRRDMLRKSASTVASVTTGAAVATCIKGEEAEPSMAAAAMELPFGIGGGSSSSSSQSSEYKPAKRAMAYLVDSTIPPTLQPFKPQREAAILKSLGAGLGTRKTSQLAEVVTFNNMMKKGVDGGLSLLGLSNAVKQRPKGFGAASFVFLGGNVDDVNDSELAVKLVTEIVRPRARGVDTAIGLAQIPQSAQTILDQYSSGIQSVEGISSYLMNAYKLPQTQVDALLPILEFAKSKNLPLLALAPEIDDVNIVRRDGLQNLDMNRRSVYVADVQGFIEQTQNPKFKLYTDYSMMKNFVPQTQNNENDNPGDYFAQQILYDETVATAIAKWSVLRPDSLVVVWSDIENVRYMGGANGRIPRICKFLSSDSKVDDESVTTILLNPTAEKTLSQTKFLRLEIGTAPENMKYQTKVADYLWFSTMPKVNMLPRMMNY